MRGKVTIYIVLTMPQVSVTGVTHRPGVGSLALGGGGKNDNMVTKLTCQPSYAAWW